MIRVGPAGWSYADWEGRVYPRVKPRGFHALRFLAPFVSCVEINSTFYALPRAEHAARWRDCVEPFPDFRFIVKLWRRFTHEPYPTDPEGEQDWERSAQAFLAGIQPLARARVPSQRRLAAILVQFPVSFISQPSSVRRLGRIRELFGAHPLVLEVRHQSWFTPPALSTIRGLKFSLAHLDLPPAWNHPPERHPATGPLGYLRLHGRNSKNWFSRQATRDERYDYLYDRAEVAGLVDRAKRIAGESEDTYVVTNNHFAGKALANALQIQALLAGAAVPAPETIVKSFPELLDCTRPSGQKELF